MGRTSISATVISAENSSNEDGIILLTSCWESKDAEPASALPASTTTTLTLQNPGATIQYPTDSTQYLLDITTLRILFCFRNLTSIVIESPLGFDLDDSAMLDIAQAWPNIESLQLRFHDATPDKPSATLGCLHAFALHCPVLRVLAMALDATVIPATDGNSVQNCLEQLHVFEYPLLSAGVRWRTSAHVRDQDALDMQREPVKVLFSSEMNVDAFETAELIQAMGIMKEVNSL
ncbi:hypothetical protein B0H14DRAFT_2587964 [Mycena olivaceomarginata]|nr:hypothetical protein B0H14DRAFT_2587964 [Mycena olivaceomarginata]